MFGCGRPLLLVYYLPAMPTDERYHQYQILRREDGSLWELGRGAMGITYKAYDTNLRFTVALKVINSAYLESDTARQRFLREARAAAALRHPNVASVFNLGTDQDKYFYVMEFIDGETVEAYVKRKGPLEPAEALNIALQVTGALAVAAKQHLVHRDLKPTNLMLVDQEGESIVKVIDFGLAKVAKDAGEDSGELTIGGFVGTPHFASPEQVEEGEVDVRSDIYSLGATLYFVLTGESPFSGSVGQVMSQHLYKPLPMAPLASLPKCVVSLLQRMMEKDRHNRPQTPQDLQKAILACLEEIRAPSGRGGLKAGEPTSAFETLDLSSASGQPLATGVVLAQNYKLIEELIESPQGRKFIAEDLRRKRRVSLLVLSPQFLSDATRLTSLEEAVQLLRNAPHPLLREIYSLETDTDCSFIVEEYFVGSSLLDVLRARSVLSAPEVVRLLSLLAPVADHAIGRRLQHVDLTLPGIHLTHRASTGSGLQPDLLQRPLTAWEPLEVKVDAIDFSFLPSDTATWSGSATRIQGAADSGPRGSCVRLLSLLAYELLGGPRTRVEATGQYTPIAALTQEGNTALRRVLVDECPSAGELVRQLATAVGVNGPAASDSASAKRLTSEPLHRTLPPKGPAEVPIKRKSKISAWGWVLALGVITSLAMIGSYTIYRYLHPPTVPQVVFGNLAVESDPTGAVITLDEGPPTKAPYTFNNVKFGRHRLTANLKGYLPIEQDLQFDATTAPKIVLKLQQSPPHEIAALSVQTEPPGALILLDGTPPQAPPNTFTHVPFGTHQLTATLDNYEPIKQDTQVGQGMTPQIHLQLKPTQEIAALSVQTEPAGAAILLDGKPPQAPPNIFTHVPFGTHQLTATLDEYEPIKQDIQVHRGMTPQIHLQLKPTQEIAALSVQTEPAGASILLDGKPPEAPSNTFTHVPFGTHQLTATLDDYEPIKQYIEVRRGMTPQIHLQLKPTQEIAALSVRSEPTGAAILLDGMPPQAPSNTFTHVPFGTHQLTATLDDYEPIKQDIQVHRGMTPEIHVKLTQSQEIAALSVQTEPPGAAILLDGTPPQAPPNTFTHVPFGTHQLIATLKKYEPTKQDILVRAGMIPEIHVNLKQSPPEQIAWILSLDRGRLEEARKEFAETLQTYRELVQKNQETYRPDVARTLNNLAILDGRQGRMEEAGKEFAEALQIYRELAQKNQETYRPDVATTLNNLGNVDLDQGRLDEARKEFAEALQTRRELAQKNAELYRPFVARTLNNLAILDRRQGRIGEARKEFSEALQTYRELAQKDPETYRPFVATTLNNLGNVDLDQGQSEEARKEFAEALQIYEILAKHDPEQFVPKVERVKKALEQLSGTGKNHIDR
jgi:serine/threonine protein kinase/tetratricopeptide (TPR) repeat protein/chaperone required for assembly of F1-ATPase